MKQLIWWKSNKVDLATSSIFMKHITNKFNDEIEFQTENINSKGWLEKSGLKKKLNKKLKWYF